MQSELILSVVIPHLDRCVVLQEALDSVIVAYRNALQYGEFIEIIVVDNFSSLESRCALKKLESDYEAVRFEYRGSRLEIDESFFNCAQIASGKFIWVFGDDDIMHPLALVRVIEFILTTKSSKYLLHVNKLVFSDISEINKLRTASLTSLNKKYESVLEVFDQFLLRPGFISSVIMDRTTWLSEVDEELRYLGYRFVARFYSSIKMDYSLYYFKDIFVFQRKGRAQWKKNWTRYQLVSQPWLITDMLSCIDGRVRNAVLRRWSNSYISMSNAIKHGYFFYSLSNLEANFVKNKVLVIFNARTLLLFNCGRYVSLVIRFLVRFIK